MSKEYIEREEVIKILEHYDLSSGSTLGCHSGAIECAIFAIKMLPAAADVAPVRHGRWVHDHYEKCTEQFEIVKCSNCGIKMYAIALSVKDANYCRNCGAKMDGGVKE